MPQDKIQIPRPTGSYNVGIRTHFLKDNSRHQYNQNSRQLLVQIYYPSAEINQEYPFYLSNTMHLYKEKITRSNNISLDDLSYLDEIRDWAVPNVSINTDNAPFPVLFFSPGFLMAAQLYSSLIEEMASHGYVVIAMNHTDACWPVIFPDGSSPNIAPELANIFFNKKRSCLQTFDATQETWIKDIEFFLSWLRNQPLTKSLDLSHMGIFGHSFGGSTATEAMRQNKSFKAMANIDGLLFGENWHKSFKTPSLFIVAEKILTHKDALKAGLTVEQCDSLLARSSKKVFDKLKDHSFYVTVKNTEHASFVDSKLIKSPLRNSKPDPSGITMARALLVDFFDHYLKNKNLILLNSHRPDIVIEKQIQSDNK